MKHTYVMRGTHKHMRGFEYLVYSAISLSLLVVLLALPVAPVFASENIEASESVSETPHDIPTPVVDEEVADVVDESSVEIPENIEGGDVSLIDVPTTEPLITEPEEIISTEVAEDEIVTEIPVEENTEIVNEVTTTEEIASATSTEEIITEEEIVTDVVLPEDSEEIVTEALIEETDDSQEGESVEDVSEEVIGSTVVVDTITNNDNRFTFSKDECTLSGDGAFYCAKATPEAAVVNTDRVFSAPDADGDTEIYVEKDGELTAITQNLMDDDAPYFDEMSNTMVWHRLIDGRYQIVSYDFDSQSETQITNDRYNNMQPSRFDDATVWQGWVGDDWEIFLLEDDELTMLTDNTTHDITPSINGTHIVWQSFEANVWHMKVYDMLTGAIETIEDSEGGSIENPRFVLVYDTKFETGDVETKGYDLKSGKVLTLGSQPASIPEELPDPEQTGEERALVAPPTQPKTKTDGEIDDEPADDDLEVPPTDIVIPPLDSISDATTTLPELPISDSEVGTTTDIIDVIVTPFVDTTPLPTDHIGDLIITPYVEPIFPEVDAQETIVSGS